MHRIIHIVTSECEVQVLRVSRDGVSVRVFEKDPDLQNPTDFEIEGDPEYICEALTAIITVLTHIDNIETQEPS